MGAQSGPWMTITSGTDNALNGTATGQRPNQVLANPYAAVQSATQWLNPAAFSPAAPGTYGALGTNNVLGPGMLQIDMNLSRQFTIKEKQKLEFRAEVFNVPNLVNLNTPVEPGSEQPAVRQNHQRHYDIARGAGSRQRAGTWRSEDYSASVEVRLLNLFRAESVVSERCARLRPDRLPVFRCAAAGRPPGNSDR